MGTEDAARIRLVGLSHRTAPVAVREAAAFAPGEAVEFLARGREERAWGEALLLSTCNRTELYAAPLNGDGDGVLAERLARARPAVHFAAPGLLYRGEGHGALRSLLRVACGLDSMVLGESEIAGQVREAHRLARDAGTSGPILERLVPAALRLSARARTETGIQRGVTSVPAAALEIARRHFADLGRRRVLVVGAGVAGGLAARVLARESPGAFFVSNRTPARAAALAAEVRAAVLPWEDLPGALGDMDLVLCATRAPEPVVRLEDLRATAKARAGRFLLLLDIGVPRNVDPRARDLEGVFLHDLDAIEGIVAENRSAREREVVLVEALVDDALARLVGGPRAAAAEPLIADLRRSLEAIRAREVERSLRHFPPGQREHLEALTRSLLDHAMDPAMRALREIGDDRERERWARRLFGLPPAGGGEGGEARP